MSRAVSWPRGVRLLAFVLCALLCGCSDAVTGPAVLQQNAGGGVWTAVAVPPSVPTLKTWVALLRPRTEAERARLAEVQELRAQAQRSRRAGEHAAALAAEAAATRLAVQSLTSPPDAQVLFEMRAGLRAWQLHVEALPDLRALAPVDSAHSRVQRALAQVEQVLQLGDTLAAITPLAEAAQAVRSLSPEVVGVAALAQVEARLRAAGAAENPRAQHLLGSAREALRDGDYARAFRRALYALQLAEPGAARAAAAGEMEEADAAERRTP